MLSVLLEVSNKSLLLGLMIVLLVLLVLLTALGIVFIVALRKRAPVIKVVMAPPSPESDKDDDVQDEPEEEPAEEQLEMEEVAAIPEEPKTEEAQPAPPPAPAPEPEPEREEYEDDDDDESSTFVTEGVERVRYDRSFKAKHIQMKDESKEWYSTLKNELLSYQRVKSRLSWRKETFRIGRMPLARFVIRGKTLCLLLAIEPSGLQGTKFTVDDVSAVAATADTPCQYRIKSARRAKYAKELIGIVMKELNMRKIPDYVAQDFFVPYEGTVALMEKGLTKRVVSESTRTFEIREVSGEQSAEAAATDASKS
ncbi:MAG: hypothetical protein HFE42_04915 [Clostridia bacterium]|nr:hypothetical protein [Clostridia bacterium]